ncbi:tetratricopeptide repeat protein [Gemmatimonas sp.]|jgi:non-specific serine/threonine protein kinase/serine/threonine-protein kinase|uniref:tetratricopeptide repeat protein n=1 Tax=Gemmatimonas sp. TaxID=1962908 RepID=UPI0037BF37F8
MLRSSQPPTRIGPYNIIQLLGEGGMGVVYEAEETVPVRRRVALKLVRKGLDDAHEVLARFDAERRALAVMSHPGIARVLQAGSTDDGEPYFAMELVRGLPLTEFCDTKRLAVRERLQLFIGICEAVQHAHQKGVIHRDLKPSNILVTDEDGTPQPKIIDFGIAKALGPPPADAARTLAGFAMGTVAYMSPEQASTTAIDVDTRADIYSLGVMLYELLVGALPHDPAQVGVFEFLARLASGDTMPPTPSAGLSTVLAQSDAIAQRRRTDLRHLQRALRGDLDWITMKAMHPDRVLRYETANGLAADLRRHLSNEPVAARPPSTRYRLEKFVRRHRMGVIVAGVASVLVTVSSVVATVGFVRARRAEQLAAEEAAAATQVADFMVDLFRQSDPNVQRRQNMTALALLEQGIRRVKMDLASQPLLQARLMQTMGTVETSLGKFAEARELLDAVLRTRERLLGADHPLVGETLTSLGELTRERGELDEAEQYLTRALAIREEALGPHNVDVATTMSMLAVLRVRQTRLAEAESLYQRVLAIDALVREPNDARTLRDMRGLAAVYRAMDRKVEADSLWRLVLQRQEQSLGADHPDVGSTLNNLGTLAYFDGRYEEAARYYARSRPIIEKAFGRDHPQTSGVINNQGEVLWKLKRYAEAEPLLRQALAIKERVYTPQHASIGISLNGLAGVLRDSGRPSEAEPLYQRALVIREQGSNTTDLAETLRDYAVLLRATGRGAQAAAFEQRASATK